MRIGDVRAVVTGGGSGLGLAVADALRAGGARVAILDRAAGRTPIDEWIETDVTDRAAVERGIAAAAKMLGGITACINCAGVGAMRGAIQDEQGRASLLVEFDQLIAVNLAGTLAVVGAAIALMKDNRPDQWGGRGVIINTASISGLDGPAGSVAYSASKAGVIGLTQPLARDLAPYGIRVCTLAPGLFDTPMLESLPDAVDQELRRHMMHPRRPGHPYEFASLVLHLIENEYLNAVVIRIDGGARAPLPAN